MIELGEGGQKLQTFSYKLNRSSGRTTCMVIYSMVTIAKIHIVYLRVAKRIDLKSFHHKKKIVTMCDDEC